MFNKKKKKQMTKRIIKKSSKEYLENIRKQKLLGIPQNGSWGPNLERMWQEYLKKQQKPSFGERLKQSIITAAYVENPAVMTAAGWTPKHDGTVELDSFNTSERNKLANNLAIIGVTPAAGYMGLLVLTNPIPFILSAVAGATVDGISKATTDKTWGENVSLLTHTPVWLGEMTNPGYLFGPSAGSWISGLIRRNLPYASIPEYLKPAYTKWYGWVDNRVFNLRMANSEVQRAMYDKGYDINKPIYKINFDLFRVNGKLDRDKFFAWLLDLKHFTSDDKLVILGEFNTAMKRDLHPTPIYNQFGFAQGSPYHRQTAAGGLDTSPNSPGYTVTSRARGMAKPHEQVHAMSRVLTDEELALRQAAFKLAIDKDEFLFNKTPGLQEYFNDSGWRTYNLNPFTEIDARITLAKNWLGITNNRPITAKEWDLFTRNYTKTSNYDNNISDMLSFSKPEGMLNYGNTYAP